MKKANQKENQVSAFQHTKGEKWKVPNRVHLKRSAVSPQKAALQKKNVTRNQQQRNSNPKFLKNANRKRHHDIRTDLNNNKFTRNLQTKQFVYFQLHEWCNFGRRQRGILQYQSQETKQRETTLEGTHLHQISPISENPNYFRTYK